MSWKLHYFDTDPLLVDELAVEIGRVLQAAIAGRGQASLAVSGGSTPVALFRRLSEIDIDWAKVLITLVDERWVDEDHPDSNARLVREKLLRNRAVYARFLGLKTDLPDPFSAEPDVHDRLSGLGLPLDAVVLGMGRDGHTASFFAGARGIDKALDPRGVQLCCAVEPEAAPHARMTLTLPVILAARHCYLHIVGQEKKQVLEQAITEGIEGELPVARVLHAPGCCLQIYHAKSGENS